ncbi:MAG: magnesium transporter CorA family protein [Thermoguttaceae bacterium]
MRKNFEIIDGKLVATNDPDAEILIYNDPDENEKSFLINDLRLDEHTLGSALDPDELSRIEFEPDHIAVIFKRPKNYSAEDNFLFRISSVGIYLFENRLVVVSMNETPLYSTGKDMQNLKDLHELFLRIIARSISQFLGHIRAISTMVDELEKKIERSMSNEYLLNLFRLDKSMTYYLSAISANGVLLEKLRGYTARIGFTIENNELLEDVVVDNSQCYKQAEIYSSIMSSMTDARASVVNNNLNILMKRLTVISIVFLPLNVIAGMFGMSEYTVFAREDFGLSWPAAYILFTIGLIILGYITYLILQLAEMKEK